MRAFAATHHEILIKLTKLEKEVSSIHQNTERNSQDIENVFTVLKEMIAKDAKPAPRKRIGFRRSDDKD